MAFCTDWRSDLNSKAVSALMRGQIFIRQQAPVPQQRPEDTVEKPEPRQPEVKETREELPSRPNYRATKAALPGEEEQRRAASAPQGEKEKVMPAKAQPRVGRNDPCPCGSGKKYKNCHGQGL